MEVGEAVIDPSTALMVYSGTLLFLAWVGCGVAIAVAVRGLRNVVMASPAQMAWRREKCRELISGGWLATLPRGSGSVSEGRLGGLSWSEAFDGLANLRKDRAATQTQTVSGNAVGIQSGGDLSLDPGGIWRFRGIQYTSPHEIPGFNEAETRREIMRLVAVCRGETSREIMRLAKPRTKGTGPS